MTFHRTWSGGEQFAARWELAPAEKEPTRRGDEPEPVINGIPSHLSLPRFQRAILGNSCG